MGLTPFQCGRLISRIGLYAFIVGLITFAWGFISPIGGSFIGGYQETGLAIGLLVCGAQCVAGGLWCALLGTAMRLFRAKGWNIGLMIGGAALLVVWEFTVLVWVLGSRGQTPLGWLLILLPMVVFGGAIPALLTKSVASTRRG